MRRSRARSVLTTLLATAAAAALGTAMAVVVPQAAAAKPPRAPKAALVDDPAALVNTIVQTGAGNNYPGAQAPFGMVQWSPNTNSRGAGGNYNHNDNQLRGFALANLAGPGCGAMGDDPILPMIGGAPGNINGTMTSLDHNSEIATAGYYSVRSSDGQIRTELTATPRTGLARITYPASTQASLLIKLRDSQNQEAADPSSGRIVGNNEVIGNTTSGHFCGDRATYVLHFSLVFDRPFTSAQVLGGNQAIFVTFDTTANRVVHAKVGVSFVSDENARQNWMTENPGFNFEAVRNATHAAFNRYLGKIEVAGGTSDQRTIFYSNLYHQLNHPNIVSDVNGQYMGYDKQVHTVVAGQEAHYQNFSGWDIYHNQASLAALLAPKETGDMSTSLLQSFQQAGAIPQWGFMNSFNGVMIGDSAPAIVAQYHAFGARSVNDRALLNALIRQAIVDNRIRGGLREYDQLGYKPNDQSLTIEWTQEDFALSRLAYAMGDTTFGDFFTKRSHYWKNIFDPQTGLLSPRASNGQFTHVTPDDTTHGYVEGSAAQYRFQVPSDQPAMARMLGGNAATASLLDSLFQGGFNGQTPTTALLTNEFASGQQWFYNWIGRPARTQEVVHRWLTTVYANNCCTFPNNDDLGTMSAQYVWASMGIYPENLGTTDVTLNAPLFTQVLIHLMSGNTLTINAPQASNSNFFIQSLTVNGTPTTKTWLPGSMFTTGGTVNFTLGSTASTWGTGPNDAPPSYDGPGTPTPAPPPPPVDPVPSNGNLALNRPATSSTTPCNADEGPEKAVNGTVFGGNSDKWCSFAAGNKMLTVDLGAPAKAITKFTVRHAAAGGEGTDQNTRDFDIQVSTDGTDFSTVVQARGNTADITNHPVNTTARFIRLVVITAEQNGGGTTRIYEFEAYGPDNQPPGNTRLEAESATRSPGSTVDSNHAGFSGTGYVNTPNVVGSFVEWSVNRATAGSVTLSVRYANGSTANRPVNVVVNGGAPTVLNFPPTGAWTSWQTVTVTVALRAGGNTVRTTATTAGGTSNLDFLEVPA